MLPSIYSIICFLASYETPIVTSKTPCPYTNTEEAQAVILQIACRSAHLRAYILAESYAEDDLRFEMEYTDNSKNFWSRRQYKHWTRTNSALIISRPSHT